jgi:hypothetical protein
MKTATGKQSKGSFKLLFSAAAQAARRSQAGSLSQLLPLGGVAALKVRLLRRGESTAIGPVAATTTRPTKGTS